MCSKYIFDFISLHDDGETSEKVKKIKITENKIEMNAN